ncbi:MAG: hypothetical protein M9887_09450 [Chitinophagales bacterium]|nr:hypothetical protein [Chitinophagales bacterium]
MRFIKYLLLFSLSIQCIYAQNTDNYDKVAATFVLDSVTVDAVRTGKLNPVNFIKYTMEDTTLFNSFMLLKTHPHLLNMDAKIFDKKGGLQGKLKRIYSEQIENDCRFETYITLDSSGSFFNKKGQPISETFDLMKKFFTTPKKVCGKVYEPTPKGIVVLDKPNDKNQQREFIKRFIFAPQTIRVDVPIIGNKMKTNIFEPPTSDYYKFNVDFRHINDTLSVFDFNIVVDSVKYPHSEKSVIIKKMKTTFRSSDLAIISRTYEVYYPGLFVAADIFIDIDMHEIGNKLFPKSIHYKGEWKFPTKGKDKADIRLLFYNIKEI